MIIAIDKTISNLYNFFNAGIVHLRFPPFLLYYKISLFYTIISKKLIYFYKVLVGLPESVPAAITAIYFYNPVCVDHRSLPPNHQNLFLGETSSRNDTEFLTIGGGYNVDFTFLTRYLI